MTEENRTASDIDGPCTCPDCAAKYNAGRLKTLTSEARERLTGFVDGLFGPRQISYDDWSEFQRLKHADVEQGRRIAELLSENAQLAAENRALRIETEDLAHDLRNARLEIEELKAANERLRRQPWEGHWS